MSDVQRYEASLTRDRFMEPYANGAWMLHTDHARIVAELEQAHAAALAGMYELGKADGHLLGEEKAHRDSVIVHEGAAESRGYRRGLAAAPRTLTADDVGYHSQRCLHCDHIRAAHALTASGCLGHSTPGRTACYCPCSEFMGVTLIHDGEATPQVKPCSTCGEPVAYLTARPGWAGGWLHHPARPLDGHPAAIDGEATT